MAQTLGNLPVGAKVKFGRHQINTETPWDIKWLIVAKNHPGYSLTNAVTIFAEAGIDIRAFDAVEGDNLGGYGSGNYRLSNIRQWLNSDAAHGTWYKSMSNYDSPPVNERVRNGGHYLARPGFLYYFSSNEKDAILTTGLYDELANLDSQKNFTDKVFLPSMYELSIQSGYLTSFGERWEASTQRPLTQTWGVVPQVTQYAETSYKAGEAWTRNSAINSGIAVVTAIASNLYRDEGYRTAEYSFAVRPALNLPATTPVSDYTDAEGYYTVTFNTAPIAPATLNVPLSVYGGNITTISWSEATDPDGDAISYVLEVAYDGGSFEQIYAGVANTYNHTPTYGLTSVQYRVAAKDSNDAPSAYTTSGVREIINNRVPVVSGTDADLGVKTTGFSQSYSVTDQEGDPVTVTEAIDGIPLRTYAATLGTQNSLSVTGEAWLKLSNGNHAATITATDTKGGSSVRTFTFVKDVTVLTVETANPLMAATKPTRILFNVSRSLPPQATIKVEVCNNGYDANPTWEDASDILANNLVYVFKNATKTATNWGVRIRVTVDRNGGEGACYISGIGGNFE